MEKTFLLTLVTLVRQAFNTKAILMLLSTLILSACGKEPIIEEKEEISKVVTKALSELLVDYTFYRPAQAISLNNSTLSAELSATVVKVHAQVGDTVSQGDALIELNCSDEQYRLQQSSAQLKASNASAKLSELDYQRARRLFKQKNISKQELDRLQSEHERNKANQGSARAANQLALNSVDKCIIRAPFTAVVVERSATIGQLASVGTPLIRVMDTTNLELSAFLSPAEARVLQASQDVYFLQNGQHFPLNLRSITPAIDSTRRTQEVRLLFDQSLPLPGGFGELVWVHPLPALPAEYLSLRQGVLGILYASQGEEKVRAKFESLSNAKEGQPYPLAYTEILTELTPVLTDGRFGINIDQEIQLSTEP